MAAEQVPGRAALARKLAREYAAAALCLAAAWVGGKMAALAGLPLPWMIGPLLTSALLVQWVPVKLPLWIRPIALLILGLALGQSFNGEVLRILAGSAVAIAFGAAITIVAGLGVAHLFAKLAKADLRTGYYCAVPGGVIVMAVQAERAGADVAVVTFSQSIRLLLVVLLLPPIMSVAGLDHGTLLPIVKAPPVSAPALAGMVLAGAGLVFSTRRLNLANPWMILPCLMSIGLSVLGWAPSGVPHIGVDLAQLVLGVSLGSRLTRAFFRTAGPLVIASVASTLLLATMLLLAALGMAWLSGLPMSATILGMAPGGMPEMTVTARVLDVAVPLVLSFHLTRIVLCNLLVEPIWRAGVRLGLADE